MKTRERIAKVHLTIACCLLLQITFGRTPGDEILWDRYGVPHIYATDMRQMYYEFGWAQMHNHANLLLRLYGQARGRAAEYWGEEYLASDKLVHLFQVQALAEKEYEEQTPGFKAFLDAFVKGINDYARAHADAIDEDYRRVLPVRPQDVLAHGIRVIYLNFVAGAELGMASRRGKPGSNACAIGPSRSSSGNALLLTNPHLPWGDLYTFFEAHLQAPGFNAYGVTVVGMPVLSIAFNGHLGWTHTVNPIDACDRYSLQPKAGGYLLDGQIVPFQKTIDVIKVRQKGGAEQETSLQLLYSRQGPVMAMDSTHAIAVRIAGIENPAIYSEWHQMALATNWPMFEKAVRMMQLPMFNILYADDRGHIAYIYNGNVPRREGGDWAFWSGVVDGSNSGYIWQTLLPYEQLPKLLDPGTGFLQNGNDPPWTCTYPVMLDPHDFPAWLSPQGMALRPQRAVNLIRRDSLISFAGLADIKMNTGMEAADRFLDELLKAVRQYPDTLAVKAAAVLERWDRTCNADSKGAVLFTKWFDKVGNDLFTRPWTPEAPVTTPDGLKDARRAVMLLTQAAMETIKEYDSLNVAWGDVYRFRIHGLDLPANGGPDRYGTYRTIYFAKDKDNKYRAVAGDSYVAITEFGKKVKALVLLSYGNASQPTSKHISDQLPLLARRQLREALLDRNQILSHLEEKETF